MDILTAVTFVNSVKEHYGNNVEYVFEAHARSNIKVAGIIAMQTQAFGLVSDNPQYLTDFANAGGDVEYLLYLTQSFVNVRSKLYGS